MECYDRTLRAHHNVMSRSVYTVAAKAIPYREDMLRSLGIYVHFVSFNVKLTCEVS